MHPERHAEHPGDWYVYPPASWPEPGSDIRKPKTCEGESNVSSPKKAPAEVVPMRPERATPANPTNPHPGAGLDPFRNIPLHGVGMIPSPADAPRELPPKVAGVHRHGPECAYWICEDEAPAERVQVGASA